MSPGQTPYILERQAEGCTQDVLSELHNDPRFSQVGYKTNLYEVQDDSNVWDDLKTMPQFNRDM